MKKIMLMMFFIILLQFWRVNDLSQSILDPSYIEKYKINDEIIYNLYQNEYDSLTILEKKRLLSNNQFYLRYGWNGFRIAYLVFNDNNELIYYARDFLWDTIIPEDFNRFKINNNEINFFMAEKTITLSPSFWDKIDAKLITGFAYIIHSLGLD